MQFWKKQFVALKIANHTFELQFLKFAVAFFEKTANESCKFSFKFSFSSAWAKKKMMLLEWKTANYKCNLQFLICSCKCNLLKKWQKKLQFAFAICRWNFAKKNAIHWKQMQIAVFYLQLQLQFAEKSANKMAICSCSCNCSFLISWRILQHTSGHFGV